jgi:DNA repair protein RadC
LPFTDHPLDPAASYPTSAPKTDDQVLDRAFEILARRHRRGEFLDSPAATQQFLRLRLAERTNEVFGVIYLDNRHRVIDIEELFFGSIDGAAVHPRVVVERSLHHNAAAVLFFHNHPSGVTDPSQADEHITRRLREALNLIDVRVLDHFIVSAEGSTSFAERGLI